MGYRGKNGAALRVRFWGVRGSYPAPGPATVRIGGNSSCVEIEAGAHTLIFDAGTGIIALGKELLRRDRARVVHIFLSHFHHDHIEGLRYFEPAYRPDWRCYVYGPGAGGADVARMLDRTMEKRLFPVSLAELPAQLKLRTLSKRQTIRLAGSPAVRVQALHSSAHPKVGVLLYRVECAGRSVVYATDVEAPKGGHDDVVRLAHRADLLIHDAQYSDAEYFHDHRSKVGWGHSTVRMSAEIAREAEVNRLLLYHHDPTHDDRTVRQLERLARKIFPATQAAAEGLEIQLAGRRSSEVPGAY
jgi:phosphoribosyl 1,2-cyclic phosphodiesterase